MKTPIIVTVDDAHMQEIDNVADNLRKAGMQVGQVLTVTGSIVGYVEKSDLSKLGKITGVRAVDIEPISEAQ